ncbi:S9 family peptidase [Nocardioides sp. GY 10113]|uniref:prolyl oligopeptidase family serine peptidase n=1 Tax=Nocardioides sp. GY 10113 TaxID=2569761 RepID=UPI0010A76157|nr:prolyl oligopeptidase family serine peptidase [Nocardioides sp. GY 10113]TIC80462.1 S9 family peptidase [Nocardioides sp. GY 10113]
MTQVSPPRAVRRPFEHREHDVPRADPYHWMAAGGAELVTHLEAERDYYDAATAPLRERVEELAEEMVARVPATEASPWWARTRYRYSLVTPPGGEYADLVRRPLGAATDAAAETVLDVCGLADGSDYFELGLTLVSPDEHLLAYSVDTEGDEVYELRFRDLRTGADLDEVVPRSYYGGAWSADATTFFYTVHDEAYRPHQVWRHRLGTPAGEDVLVVAEPDERFALTVRGSRSGQLVLIRSESRDTGEEWAIDAAAPEAPPRTVGARRPGIVYRSEHLRDGPLLVVTNDGATEFRLVAAPVPRDADQDHTVWKEVRAEDPAERLERVDAFATHAVLSLRADAEHRLRVVPLDDLAAAGTVVRSAFDGGAVRLARTTSYDVGAVVVADQAHVAPPVWSDLTLADGTLREVLRAEAPGHEPGRYRTERITVPSTDGTPVPVTLVRHRDTPLDGTAPLLLYGYGSYEYTFEPDWDPALPSLLDRGVVFAHAHVRGGGEGGRRWWLDGRLEHKQHTFTDFVAVADGLAGTYVDGDRIASRGLSAGGLLQGAVFSQRPDRWRAVVAEVPFVDVVTTMLDASIPLTVNEWDEWGDPRRRADFDWMLAYSPYDNPPPAGGRPDLLATGALHDPRVMVHEPAKWVALLRETDPEWAPRCLFRVETGAGSHTGPSGRFGHLGYEAEVYAWVLDRLGVA